MTEPIIITDELKPTHSTEVDSCGCRVVPDKMEAPLNAACPKSSTQSKKVPLETLENLIIQDKRDLISKDVQYYNCSDPECEVVYFSNEEAPTFNVDDISVKVFEKDSGNDVKVCYCFNWTRERITDQFNTTGSSTALDEVRDEMNAGNCECKRKNPKGDCCLGDIQRYLKEIA